MGILKLCFSLVADKSDRDDALEQNYHKVYKRFASFLYAHPKLPFSVSFSGAQLSFYKKNHLEYIDLISQLTSRKQLEVLGGGYYNPIFPLLFPQDRSGQIELLTSELRQTIGKRPRGMTLCGSVWESSLIPCLQTCGMEYIFLDSTLLTHKKNRYLPIIAAYQGKSVAVLPLFRNLESMGNQSAADYVSLVLRKVQDEIRDDENFDADHVVSISVSAEEMEKLLDSHFLDDLAAVAENKSIRDVEISNPLVAVKNCTHFERQYIPAGMNADIAKNASLCDNGILRATIYDLLQYHPRSDSLYRRMMYVSLLTNQCHGDKMRKKEARERLWEGQNGKAYICSTTGSFAPTQVRQAAFRSLNAAEKLVREAGEFNESVTAFDYNADGIAEYICQMQSYTACIERVGACISELEILRGGNAADSLSEKKHGLFVDYLLEVSDFDDFVSGKYSGNAIFAKTLFSETMFDPQRREVRLSGSGVFSEMQQTVSLRKKFMTTSSGISVQYILRNESPIVVRAKLVAELNFADTHFAENCCYASEIISAGTRKNPENNTFTSEVSYVQLTDTLSNVAFVLVPNENAGVVVSQSDTQGGRTVSVSLCWDVDLAAGREVEKNVTLSIMASRPRRA